jgi:hypothetical protein
VLVEVGAAHPDYLSMSASYRSRGWRIIAIEPKTYCGNVIEHLRAETYKAIAD